MIKIATRVQRYISAGSGNVRARFSPDQYTDLIFIPLDSAPQGIIIPEDQMKYAIASLKFHNTYLRMDGHQLFTDKAIKPTGGGRVNCQFTVGPFEMFRITPDQNVPDTVNIQSVKYPGVYLRMDSLSVSSTNRDGRPGSVNAQWSALDLERFQGFQIDDGSSDDGSSDDGSGDADLRGQIEDLKKQLADRDANILKLEADLKVCQDMPPKIITIDRPGPTQYVDRPGPTQYVDRPGPTQYIDRPGPTQYVKAKIPNWDFNIAWQALVNLSNKYGIPTDQDMLDVQQFLSFGAVRGRTPNFEVEPRGY
jgi:hypothetical protein